MLVTHVPRRATASAIALAAALAAIGPAGCGAPDGAARPRDIPRPAATATADTSGASRPAATDTGRRAPATLDTALLMSADAARAQGDTAAPVVLLIVSDFQCPYCRAWHAETYPQLRRDYIATGKVRAIYFNLPLPSHSHAWPAAEAAMCAAAQGRFWPMQDALFDAQGAWAGQARAGAVFDSLAASVGVRMDAFRDCERAHAARPLVESDNANAQRMGIASTPTFIVVNARGDRKATAIQGAQPLAQFRQVIDSVLAAGRGAPRAPGD